MAPSVISPPRTIWRHLHVFLTVATTYYLATILGLMALGQSLSFRSYARAMSYYRIPKLPVGVLATTMLGLEITSAFLLLVSATRLTGALLALITTSLWTLISAQAFARRVVVTNCACFGKFLGQKLRWWVLLEDVAFVAAAILVLRHALN